MCTELGLALGVATVTNSVSSSGIRLFNLAGGAFGVANLGLVPPSIPTEGTFGVASLRGSILLANSSCSAMRVFASVSSRSSLPPPSGCTSTSTVRGLCPRGTTRHCSHFRC